MNKKEVSIFLTGVTGRLLCAEWSEFFEWAEVQLGHKITSYEREYSTIRSDSPFYTLSDEITDSITDAEWQEIADFFIGSEEDNEVKK
jgi:hypothetical protein